MNIAEMSRIVKRREQKAQEQEQAWFKQAETDLTVKVSL